MKTPYSFRRQLPPAREDVTAQEAIATLLATPVDAGVDINYHLYEIEKAFHQVRAKPFMDLMLKKWPGFRALWIHERLGSNGDFKTKLKLYRSFKKRSRCMEEIKKLGFDPQATCEKTGYVEFNSNKAKTEVKYTYTFDYGSIPVEVVFTYDRLGPPTAKCTIQPRTIYDVVCSV